MPNYVLQLRLEEELSSNGLPPLWNRALALLIESNKTLPEIAAELDISRMGLWRIRKEPKFQAAYRELMAMVQADAQSFAIASRVSRIEALNDEWLRVREYQMKRKGPPRTDLSYALIALQSEARKEIEGDVHRVEFGGRLEITQAIQVIRFEALPPREEPEGDVIEGDFAEIPEPPPDPDVEFTRALHAAGVRIDRGTAQPEELAAIRGTIEERGLDPCAVLSDAQFREVYSREKGDDPWAI